jgi:hypothetical protein
VTTQIAAADTSRAFVKIAFPTEALPWPILAILLVGFFAVVGMLIHKADWFKGYAQDFPTQTSTVMAGIGGFVATMLVSLSRGALGMQEWGGAAGAYAASCAFAGVGGAMFGVKRFSSPEYQDGKAKVEAAKAGAAPVPAAQVIAADGSTVNTQAPPNPAAMPVPQAGVKPKNPAVVAGVEAIAAAQRGEGDEGII